MSDGAFKYTQIKDYVIAEIREKRLLPGQKIEGEYALVQRFELSRNTVRLALKQLCNEGYLYSARGKGTFVRQTNPVSSRKIGMIVYDLSYTTHPLTARLVKSAGEHLEKYGYMLDIFATSRKSLDENIMELTKNYAGFLIVSYQIEAQAVRLLAENGVPHFFVKNFPDSAEKGILALDYRSAGWEVTKHLYELGHRQMGLLYAGETYPAARSFREGVQAACLEFGCMLRRTNIREVMFSGEDTERTVVELLAAGLPSALITMEDTIAALAIRTLAASGIKIPADCSVTGCNNMEISQLFTPGITTISLPVEEIGLESAKRMLAWLETGEPDMENRYFAPKLVVRESTGSCKSNTAYFSSN